MDREAQFLHQIQETFPDLVIESVRSPQRESQYNQILILNDTWVFRFPRYAHGVSAMLRENNLLGRIGTHLPLPVPDPIYTSQNTTIVGQVFSGYRLLPGESLYPDKLAAIPQERHQPLADQLGTFLRQLHAIPEQIHKLIEPPRDSLDEWDRMYAQIRARLFDYMRPEARLQVASHFETFLQELQASPYQPCLRHGDFGGSNILYDPDRLVITGIIDFSSLALGDPAVDIAAAATLGESFVLRMSSVYPEIETMLPRARFYRGTFALQEALAGLQDDDRAAFERGIAPYLMH